MEEPNVFQGVGPDEMVISIAEYEEMKKQIDYLKDKDKDQFRLRQSIRDENMELRSKNSELEKENQQLKRGILKFVKYFGGNN